MNCAIAFLSVILLAMQEKLSELITQASRVVILQADNPDADSLASALALEQILHEMRKEPYLYCGVEIPSYLHYLPGWDRVSKELPTKFDLSIIVDTSADSLFESLEKSRQKQWVAAKPAIIIDHHEVEATIPFATVVWNKPAVATGEVIYELAQTLGWRLNQVANEMLAASIMADSLGLSSEGVTARSVEVLADLVKAGVSLAKLENSRRELMRKSPELLRYKGELLQRIEYAANSRLAMITIPWDEIEKYSPLYNPPMLVLDDMRQSEGTALAIAFKIYKEGKITAKIRANYGKGVAGKLAEHFGGGGHAYASGFKLTDGRPFEEVKTETISVATTLLDKLDEEQANEAL